MRFFLAGVAVVLAFAGTAEAIEPKPPPVDVHMELRATHELYVRVDGLERPASEKIALYPEGQRANSVHPTWVVPPSERGPISLAIVYQASSDRVVQSLRNAFDHIALSRELPAGSQVTLVAYGEAVETRIPWSLPSRIDGLAFESWGGASTKLADAIAHANGLLEQSPTPRRMLAIFSDFCDANDDAATRLREANRADVDVQGFMVFSMKTRCERRVRGAGRIHHVPDDLLEEDLRSTFRMATGLMWTARFDVRSLGVLGTGDRMMVLDVAGYETRPVYVSFPGPTVEPSWFSSRLRQIGLGALLVGLIALVLRWRIDRRVAK